MVKQLLNSFKLRLSFYFQRESVLRLFTLLFALLCLFPLGVLSLLYLAISVDGSLLFGWAEFYLFVYVTVIGAAAAYGVMRWLIERMLNFTSTGSSIDMETELGELHFEIMSTLAATVDAKDVYSRGHVHRVGNYCMMIAGKLGLKEADLNILRDAAALHDVGKIGIPEELIKKNGPLSDQEWAMMRLHPSIGEGMIKPIPALSHLCDIIRHHHEKLDGSGYPDGLKGDEITLLVRITTIADIYDALTTDRSYRRAYKPHQACKILEEMTAQLDQGLVALFVTSLREKGVLAKSR